MGAMVPERLNALGDSSCGAMLSENRLWRYLGFAKGAGVSYKSRSGDLFCA
jgi:hypothetical protein